ncbi:MAG: pyridoxal-phosphate dependent enzyme [Woeseiaceae bacterium]|nr:pyridoxal-phosphate dependent enzyme [Woeseiaceae bacterium]
MSNHLSQAYPTLGERLPVIPLADLPTPVSRSDVTVGSSHRRLSVKHDDVTASRYGGNKVRKLEYVLARARARHCRRIATFGAVGSNHAVATALYSGVAGFECTCFLSHQSLKPGLGKALRFHQQHGTEVVRLAIDRPSRIEQFRHYLQNRGVWVVPLGGSSWLGSVGFVNAGLELAAQIGSGELPCPARIYVALGTMGTAAGLALGLALADLPSELHAVRVTAPEYANPAGLQYLIAKTADLMRHYDDAIPADLADCVRVVFRDEFVGAGYGRTTAATDAAIAWADEELDITLESTYSGKTMAAVLHDLGNGFDGEVLFWNTFNSRPLEIDNDLQPDFTVMPREFARYFD